MNIMGYSSSEKPVLLIGSNIRFLAENGVRHGHHIFTVDYYGDWDTRQLGPNRSIIRDGDGDFSIESLVSLADGIVNCAIVYGPGFENDTRSLLSLKKAGRLIGCGVDSIRKARNPVAITTAASTWGFKYAEISMTAPNNIASSKWLAKPVNGMGGGGIVEAARFNSIENGPFYFQRFVEGMPSSALVVSDGSSTTVLGAMTQIIGDESLGADGFRYAGNVYPHPFLKDIIGPVTEIAESLTLEFNLKGLWGFDFIYDGSVILIEVNPRPTAGMGLLGSVTLNDLLGMHIDSVTRASSKLIFDQGDCSGYTAQARVFALSDGIFHDPEQWYKNGGRDIPEDGEFISKGAPILTLTESATTYQSVMEKLRDRALTLQSSLTIPMTAPA
jgi:predicted ATP-grasp superfamily ATP-dependent carboligase